jgi:hypothetical protein
LEEATSDAVLNVGTIGFWQDLHYRVRGEYGALWELRETNGDARRLTYNDPTRSAEIYKSVDNKAVLVVARDLGNRVECATYRRNGEVTANPKDVTEFASKILDMHGWPGDIGAFKCRRAGIPWNALHWLRLGYVSDNAVRAAIGNLR